MKKYVRFDFHTNYFSDDDPVFHVFGFTVDDPTGKIQELVNGDDWITELAEELEGMLETSLTAVFYPEEQFFGSTSYEIDDSHLDNIISGMEYARKWFEEAGGIVGELVTVVGGEQDDLEGKLKVELGM